MERIEFLEKKIKEQNEDHREDNRRLAEIIERSREMFKTIFTSKEKDADVGESIVTTEALDTTLESKE